MPKAQRLNIAQLVYQSYPHSDLLPVDPEQDCQNLRALAARVACDNIGDTLFRFLVIEILEGGQGSLVGAIRVVERAREDVDAVLGALIEAKHHCHSRKGRAP